MTSKRTTTIVALSLAVIMASSNIHFADAHMFGTWASPTQKYYCTTSLNTIPHTSHVSPCGDLTTSTNRWNDVSGSSLSLTQSTSYYSGVISVFGSNLGAGVAGFMSPKTNPLTTGVYVAYNTNTDVNWGDVAVGDSGTHLLDYQSTAGHEMGHAMGVDHNSSSLSVMYATTYYNNVNRLPDLHDRLTIQGAYP
jgi:hypothetical protein